ncbi:MAG: glycosyltransferase [Planctomycetaceae bacterium]
MHQRVPPFAVRRHRRGFLAAEGVLALDEWSALIGVDGPAEASGLEHRSATTGSAVVPIDPLPPGTRRPRFSVMLPTFEPDHTFERALASVLAQAPVADDMQIAVVDDASREVDVRRLIDRIDVHGRVEFHPHRRRLGLGRNWNRALTLARGELVHLLHQDDFVLPGFYARMDRGLRAVPGVGMAFCRSRFVDGGDRCIKTASRLQWTAGILANWLPRIAERQRVQTPSAVVPRATFERLGGFRIDLRQALDWEMWVRIAALYPVWYDPNVLAVYRRHDNSESMRLLSSGAVWPDLIHTIAINAGALPESLRVRVRQASARWHAGSAIRTAEKQLVGGNYDAAATTLEHLPRLLELLPRAGDRSLPLRRAGILQDRLRTARRRAA